MYEPGIDILIVNHKTPRDLAMLCSSLEAHRPTVPHSIWIFNVAPSMEDNLMARRWQNRLCANVISDERNVGYARAVHTMGRRTRRECVLVLNADVQATPGGIDECYRELMRNPQWGVLGPRQLDEDGRITHGPILGSRKNGPRDPYWHTAFPEDLNETTDVVHVPYVRGAVMFIKRACWDDLSNCGTYRAHLRDVFGTNLVGPLLPTFLYFEETFCCYHAVEHDWQVVYYGAVTMTHGWHHSIGTHLSPQDESKVIDTSRAQFIAACDAVHGMPHAGV